MARPARPKPEWPDGAVFTVGHSILSIEDFAALLAAYGIETVADIRTVPRSRRNPQFNADALPKALASHGVEYVGLPGLGGLRKTSKDSPNKGWRNDSFRGYADYMQTPAFTDALGGLIDISRHKRVAIMCAEAVPWRCHRSLVADALTARGWQVRHIVSKASQHIHQLTPFAAVEGESVTYPQH